MLNAAKLGHSADPVSAVTKKGKTLLGVKHPIYTKVDSSICNASGKAMYKIAEVI